MLDAVDSKLLSVLMKDSRAPISKIVKTPGLTREIVRYRMDKLIQEGEDYLLQSDDQMSLFLSADQLPLFLGR